MQRVEQFLKKARAYFLATVEGSQPRVRPFGTAQIIGGRLCIQTGKTKEVAKQILANPKVELCAFDGEEWVRVAGELALDEKLETKAAMLDAYPELKKLYSAEDPNTAIFYFKSATATFYSFTKAPEVVKF